MTSTQLDQPHTTLLFSHYERSRLLRLCTRLTGDPAAADDLVQETLITAWQRQDQLTDPSGLSAWLATIARNHYRHWVRSRSRRQKYIVAPETTYAPLTDDPTLAASWDLDATLDREEMVDLLDRAMGQLPTDTQTLLVSHYIDETPQAELAAAMGIKAGAVAGRLHRGKEMLRQLLVTKFRDDALTLGLIAAESAGWQTTRIWCTSCGERRLRGKFFANQDGQLLLQCECGANHGVNGPADLLQGRRGYRPAWTHAKQWQHTFLQAGLQTGTVNCPHCQQTIPLQITTEEPSVWTHCRGCGWRLHTDLLALAGSFPEKIRF
ncbi:MAG: RNA polymerase sigma factor, partial [Caldilineaceae bacterium]|nr:RNA polymerase sigma factor [Caldilineaceae bacterium]